MVALVASARRAWVIAAIVVGLAGGGIVAWAVTRDGSSSSGARAVYLEAETWDVVVVDASSGQELRRASPGIRGVLSRGGEHWVSVIGDEESAYVDVDTGAIVPVEATRPVLTRWGGIAALSDEDGSIILIDPQHRRIMVEGELDDPGFTLDSVRQVPGGELIARPDGLDATAIDGFDGESVTVPGQLVAVSRQAVLTSQPDGGLGVFGLDGDRVATIALGAMLLAASADADDAGFLALDAGGDVYRISATGEYERTDRVEVAVGASQLRNEITGMLAVTSYSEGVVVAVAPDGRATRVELEDAPGVRSVAVQGDCVGVGYEPHRVAVVDRSTGELTADVALPEGSFPFVLRTASDCTFAVYNGPVVDRDGALTVLPGDVVGLSPGGSLVAIAGPVQADGARRAAVATVADLSSSVELPSDSVSPVVFFEA